MGLKLLDVLCFSSLIILVCWFDLFYAISFWAFHEWTIEPLPPPPPDLPCIMKLMKMHDSSSGESATPPRVCCSSPSNKPDWTDTHQHTNGARVDQHTQPAHHARWSLKTCAACKDVHKTSFFVVFQCPVANHNVLAM
jgi:hypothetical protein